MAGYQLSFLGSLEYGSSKTCNSLLLDLWRCWSEGNTAYTTRKVNRIVAHLSERIQILMPVPQKTADNGAFYFVNVSVDEDDLPEIEQLFPTPEVTFRLLTAVLVSGLKVSFAVNAKNDLTICSLSDRREGSASFGACLTGGADGWYDSLCVCLYKFTALLQGDFANGSKGGGEKPRII